MWIESFKSINNKNYLDEESIQLFLDVWNRLNLFETVNVDIDWKEKSRYKHYNAIRLFSVAINKIISDEQLKYKFKDVVQTSSDTDVINLLIDIALQCWLEYSSSEYTQTRVEIFKEDISKLQNIEFDDIPTIPDQIIPDRYWSKNPENLIDKDLKKYLLQKKILQNEKTVSDNIAKNFIKNS